jgi:hypothetical protein
MGAGKALEQREEEREIHGGRGSRGGSKEQRERGGGRRRVNLEVLEAADDVSVSLVVMQFRKQFPLIRGSDGKKRGGGRALGGDEDTAGGDGEHAPDGGGDGGKGRED